MTVTSTSTITAPATTSSTYRNGCHMDSTNSMGLLSVLVLCRWRMGTMVMVVLFWLLLMMVSPPTTKIIIIPPHTAQERLWCGGTITTTTSTIAVDVVLSSSRVPHWSGVDGIVVVAVVVEGGRG